MAFLVSSACRFAARDLHTDAPAGSSEPRRLVFVQVWWTKPARQATWRTKIASQRSRRAGLRRGSCTSMRLGGGNSCSDLATCRLGVRMLHVSVAAVWKRTARPCRGADSLAETCSSTRLSAGGLVWPRRHAALATESRTMEKGPLPAYCFRSYDTSVPGGVPSPPFRIH